MKGEHTHDWHYDQTQKLQWTNGKVEYSVVRFCPDCLKVETLQLKNDIYEPTKK